MKTKKLNWIEKIIKSENPGPTIAIIGGIHGNEPAGVKVLKLLEKIKPVSGTLYLIHGNPNAIAKGKRFTEENLNRVFHNTNGKKYEHVRGREIRKILKKCDALLDIHGYRETWGISKPLIICEVGSIKTAKKLGVKTISYNWKKFHKGSSDHYMDKIGKTGICIECGPNEDKKSYKIGLEVAERFLAFFGIINKKHKLLKIKHHVVKLTKVPTDENNKLTIEVK